MEKSKRRVVEGWVDKAFTHLQTAKDHFKGGVYHSDAVQASQVSGLSQISGGSSREIYAVFQRLD
jgi:hypothetical protein